MAAEGTVEVGKVEEAMEVDGEGDENHVNETKDEEDSKVNGSEIDNLKNNDDDEPQVNGEEKKEEAGDAVEAGDAEAVEAGDAEAVDAEASKLTGMYKVKVSGLPRFYPLGEFKKMIKEDLGLALSYVRCPKRGNPWVHLTFNSAEEQQRALKALHKYTWRRKTLQCSLVTNDAQKRKPEEGTGDDTDAKKAKLDLSVNERVLMVTIPYHNIPYEEQLKKKTEELKEMVQRLGDLVVRQNPELAGWAEQQREKHDGLVFQLEEIRPSPVIDSYRNKCEFRVGLNPDTQERTVGCRLENYKDGSLGVGPADSLKHLPDQMREAVKLFQDYVRKSDKEPFSVETRQGYWRHLIVRVTCTGEVMLVVVAHPQSLTDEEIGTLKDELREYFVNGEGQGCNVTSLYFQKFTEKLVGVPLPEMEHLHGKTRLEEVMLDLVFHLSPTSYFQVNTKGAEVLYSAIIELVDPTEDTTVLDLCCGTGGIGLCIAKKCGQVFGIEYLAQNIEDAKFNAEQNEITNCEFIAGRVEDILPTLDGKMTGKTVVPILDPPRTGLNQKVLGQLRKLENVKKLIYVCSNHKAPIRNFLDLCCPAGRHTMTGHPFVPVRTVPVDVVPHTMHAQMAILLERVDPSTLPKAKNPPPPAPARKSARGRGRGRGASSAGSLGRGRGRSMGPPGLPMRGGMRGRGRGLLMPRGPPMQQPRGPGRFPPGMGRPMPPPRPMRDPYMDGGYGPRPLLERDVPPPLLPHPYARRQRPVDFSADELTLSRYSDFRRDVEDAIDSSLGPRALAARRLIGGAAAAAAMLEREEMAYRAGLTRGLVGAAALGPPPALYSHYGQMAAGRFKGSGGAPMRGAKRGAGRRGRGNLR